jgi:hypothetical protein
MVKVAVAGGTGSKSDLYSPICNLCSTHAPQAPNAPYDKSIHYTTTDRTL